MTIHKAVIRSYASATHTADVQLTGSLPAYLAAVRVATNIPAAAVAIGRECSVLHLDPHNPTDALVLSIQGALPPAGGGGVTDHPLLTNLGYATAGHTGFAPAAHAHAHDALSNLAYADAAHTDFCSLATPQTITAEKIIDATTGLRFGHAAGPLLLAGVSPATILGLQGDLDVSGHAAVGAGAAVATGRTVAAIDTLAIHPSVAGYFDITGNKASGVQFTYGLSGAAKAQGTPSAAYAFGLYFFAQHNTPSPCPQLGGILLQVQSGASGAGALTWAKGLFIDAAYWAAAQPATSYGIDILDQGGATVTTAYGLRIANQTAATTVRLLELGPTTPYLRLAGGAAPAAGLTHLWLYEGTTPQLRNVAFAVADAGGHVPAGAKVLYLV